jgi:hypothetical protein
VTDLARALETSTFLAEKVASARPASAALREKLALADFAAFGLYKQAALAPAMLSSLQRGLGWGVGLGLPALGVGHMLASDARHQGEHLLRDARNQALMTAAGVGGMQALGELLKHKAPPVQHNVSLNMPQEVPQLDPSQKMAAAILVDDVLEAACNDLTDPAAKHAALVQLVLHRGDAARLLRSLLP